MAAHQRKQRQSSAGVNHGAPGGRGLGQASSRWGRVLRPLWAGLIATLALTVILGVVYPLAMTGLAQLIAPAGANGSLIVDQTGQVIGSRLIGQSFRDGDDQPLRQYFQSRPSFAGSGYDADASGASNLGPDSPELVALIDLRRAEIAEFNGVDPAAVPADALTASGSGLDPDISPAYAQLQIDRVAAARGLDRSVVADLVADHTSAPDLGYIGQSRVNVFELNWALDQI
ncbi:MAG: potassium-transporting ATPase subunit KdpC [Propionibacteriaceae bacterium]|jgi:K+-transporting ATPase ATPase C chain|nr:potassium-transporting ATPase subunit KdpC [Propionibacteriaceae bacterium]